MTAAMLRVYPVMPRDLDVAMSDTTLKVAGWVLVIAIPAYLLVFRSIRNELMRDFPAYWKRVDDPDAWLLKDRAVLGLILSSKGAPAPIRERLKGRLVWARWLIGISLIMFAYVFFHSAHVEGLKHLKP